MSRFLFAWIGFTDVKASKGEKAAGKGPIVQALQARDFDRAVLLSNLNREEDKGYLSWVKAETGIEAELCHFDLTSPTDFGEIYEAAVAGVSKTVKNQPADLTFHLSPGTPQMAAVWVILAKTRFAATLIESSKEHGVRTASVPFDISAEYLPDLLRRRDEELKKRTAAAPPPAPEFDEILTRSPIMRRVLEKARRVAVRSVPVLVEGESGTGKELLARAIHRAGPRKNQPFVAVNCGAIPAELVESELFGHKKGAFTGAVSDRRGYFEVADKGTLFLDEVGELPSSAQVKLLRVVQEGEVTPIGSNRPRKVGVRILSASNRNLLEETVQGRFREDLFYRLAVAVLKLPPLRERSGDVGYLIDHFLDRINRESRGEPGYQSKKLSPAARNLLLSHHWPGNVRELYNTLQRAAIWSDSERIEADEVRESLFSPITSDVTAILNRSLSDGLNLPDLMAQVARHYLERALEEAGGNKSRATRLVGLPSYQTFTNWLKKYGVE